MTRLNFSGAEGEVNFSVADIRDKTCQLSEVFSLQILLFRQRFKEPNKKSVPVSYGVRVSYVTERKNFWRQNSPCEY